MLRIIQIVVVALGLCVFATSAEANAPAPYSRPTGAVPGVVVEQPSPVAVEREDLVIDCAEDESPLHPSCTFVATYFLRNPAPAEEELLGAFYTAERAAAYGSGPSPPAVTIHLDGADARAEATPEQIERMDAIVRQDATIAPILEVNALALRHEPFRIRVAAGARATLVFRGTLAPIRSESTVSAREGYVLHALYARHPVFGPSKTVSREGSEDDFLYLVSPISPSRWSGDAEVNLRIRHRTANDFAVSSPAGRFAATQSAGITTESIAIRASSRQNLRFRLVYAEPFIHNGGPVIGMGQRIGRQELRVRLGYEIGLSTFLLLGGSADTDFKDFVTAAATVDAATPVFAFIIPSISLGAGVPVQFRRDVPPRVGARAQIGISWPILSLVFPIDVYPAENSSGSHVEASFLAQLSF